jgi:hypothetical protein
MKTKHNTSEAKGKSTFCLYPFAQLLFTPRAVRFVAEIYVKNITGKKSSLVGVREDTEVKTDNNNS